MWFLLVPLLHLLGALSAIDAILRGRTSQGTIAWVVSLVSFPYMTLPIYWVFGRQRFRGYVTARGTGMRSEMLLDADVRARILEYKVETPLRPAAAHAAEALAGMPTLVGNRAELLIDGAATFDSILAGIAEAREYVLFQFFIVNDDRIGREVHTALCERARSGVAVYFLYDEVGSKDLCGAYLEVLREAGVRVSAFFSTRGLRNSFQLNFRNHRKVVVVDGEAVWIGGHNVGDAYLGRNPKFGHWRDTHVRIEGPAALAAQLSFVEDWRWATEETLELNWAPHLPEGGNAAVLVVPSGPADKLETATLMFVHALATAQDRIWIASPYFVPDEAIVTAIQLACLREVDVRILIPDRPDHLLVYMAAWSFFQEMVEVGVRFFRYTDGFLHEKAILVDGAFASVGTANFDNRSFRLNFEITAIIQEPGFVGEVEAMFERDFACSREMQAGELAARSLPFRLGAHFSRLLSPIL